MGERTPLALIDAPASGRMAVGEAITNIAAARIAEIGDVKLSANWMAAAGHPGEDAALFDTVHAVAMELCPALGHQHPGRQGFDVDADRVARTADAEKAVTAPLSLIVSAFAPVAGCAPDADAAVAHRYGRDATAADRSRLRPQAARRLGARAGLRAARQRSARSRRCRRSLKRFFAVIQTLNRDGMLLAYHDRSDGGLFATLCEMMFAGALRRIDRSTSIASTLGRQAARRRCSTRSWARCSRCARDDCDAVLRSVRDARSRRAVQVIGAINRRRHG